MVTTASIGLSESTEQDTASFFPLGYTSYPRLPVPTALTPHLSPDPMASPVSSVKVVAEYNPLITQEEHQSIRTFQGSTQYTATMELGQRDLPPDTTITHRSILKEEVKNEAKAHLTPEIRHILQILRAITITKGLQSQISIDSLIVSTFTNYDEGWTQLTYEVNVDALPLQALAFWDSLGLSIDEWKSGLSESLSNLLTEKIVVHVNWP